MARMLIGLVCVALAPPIAAIAQGIPSAQITLIPPLDIPIEQLVENTKTKAVLDADLPGLTNHPKYPLFKSKSLRQLAPISGGQITASMLIKTSRDLALQLLK